MRKFSKGAVQKHYGQWQATLSYQEDGKRKRITYDTGVKCFPGKDDMRGRQSAERILQRWRDEVIANEASNTEEIYDDAPLAEYCIRYAESRLHLVKDSTYLGYFTELRRVKETKLGKTPIGEITQEDISRHESTLAANGLSNVSIRHHHAFLASVFKEAVINRKIPYSPMAAMKSPKTRRKPINSLTTEGRAKVLDLLWERVPDEFSTAIIIALMTGMRRGEICALRWTDIDLESRTIAVNYSYSRTLKGGFELTSPKDPGGSDSKRAIPFGEGLASILIKRRRLMEDMRRMLGVPWKQSLFVVGNALTEKPYSPDMITRDWRAFTKSNGILGSQAAYPVFHDLRHTFATLAIKEQAIDIKTLAEILGHKDAAMTLNVYADALGDAKRAAMERLDALL